MTTYNPILIPIIRRAMPQMIAYDIIGVQPMTGPSGLILNPWKQVYYVGTDIPKFPPVLENVVREF
jgi:hypothetical protein